MRQTGYSAQQLRNDIAFATAAIESLVEQTEAASCLRNLAARAIDRLSTIIEQLEFDLANEEAG